MLQQNTKAPRHGGQGGGGFLRRLIGMHVVKPNELNLVTAAAQDYMIVDQHPDAGAFERRDHGLEIMVAHDAEDAVPRAHVFHDPGQRGGSVFVAAGQAIPAIAGQYAEIGVDSVENAADRCLEVDRPVGVEVAHMQDRISAKCRRQIRQRDVEPVQLGIRCVTPPAGMQPGYLQPGFEPAKGRAENRTNHTVFEF